ncbi:MAG: class I SAM-dependent methyltransferase [Myxococcota bacterium]
MSLDPTLHNKEAWNKESTEQSEWCTPVSRQVIAAARRDEWHIILTPNKAVPRTWFPELKGAKVLGLAAGGGQQCPVLAAAGAEVTVFDNSEVQLQQDRMVADREGLSMATEVGDMADLSRFEDASFDLIVHPCSNLFVPDLRPVWSEAYRVLMPGGALLAGFMNPVYFAFDRDLDDNGVLEVKYRLPYSDLGSLPQDRLQRKIRDGEALEFSHTLQAQIGGQLEAGFLLAGLYEDDWADDATSLNRYMPTNLATRAIKPPVKSS